jgi:hypothetical protein
VIPRATYASASCAEHPARRLNQMTAPSRRRSPELRRTRAESWAPSPGKIRRLGIPPWKSPTPPAARGYRERAYLPNLTDSSSWLPLGARDFGTTASATDRPLRAVSYRRRKCSPPEALAARPHRGATLARTTVDARRAGAATGAEFQIRGPASGPSKYPHGLSNSIGERFPKSLVGGSSPPGGIALSKTQRFPCSVGFPLYRSPQG